jgi:hypothetical protein
MVPNKEEEIYMDPAALVEKIFVKEGIDPQPQLVVRPRRIVSQVILEFIQSTRSTPEQISCVPEGVQRETMQIFFFYFARERLLSPVSCRCRKQ